MNKKNSTHFVKSISKYLLAICFIIWGAGMLIPVHAQENKMPHSEAEIVSEVDSIQPGQAFWVALRLKTEDHWHTYWQNPGDAGLATTIKWELPEGFKADSIQWPYPSRIEAPPLVSYGYDGEVFLLVKITPSATVATDKPVKLAATAKWLVCREACLPANAKLSLELPVKNEPAKPSTKWAQAFTEARTKLPVAAADWKFTATTSGQQLIIKAVPPAGFKQELSNVNFFPTDSGLIDYAAPQNVKKTADGYSIELKRAEGFTDTPPQIQGVLVSAQGWQSDGAAKAVKVEAPVDGAKTTNAAPAGGTLTGNQPPPPDKTKLTSLWTALLFSFIGGLILNLMPCVLPVLSIKVLDFVKQANKENVKVWHHGAIFTLGVLVSFWTLAGALIALRAGGEKLGWGFQLQSPTFLILLATLFFLFGLNLFGVFEVGTSLMGVGSKASNQSGWVGSFSSGALATLVATPCTAPFMGSALGFALTQPVWASMLIFTAVALGMSTPYILLSFSPTLLKFVPKPGAWMETFKQFMGFLLMATVVWLSWVLGIQAGVNALAALMLSLVVMGVGAWILGRWGNFMSPARSRMIAQAVMIILVSAGVGFALNTARNGSPTGIVPDKDKDGIAWQPFTPELVEKLRADGKPVFVDFTAAWCLSCQVNERVAFSSTDVREQFKKLGIVALRADWTSRDENITKTLEGFGRSGVPLYVMYYPKQTNPTILPEVITASIVLDELKKLENQISQK